MDNVTKITGKRKPQYWGSHIPEPPAELGLNHRCGIKRPARRIPSEGQPNLFDLHVEVGYREPNGMNE